MITSAKIIPCSKENKRSTGTMTIEEEDGKASRGSSLSVLECSVGDLPISNFTHPFGLQTTKSTQVVSVKHDNEELAPEEEKASSEVKKSPRIDEWPAIPLQLKATSQKLIGPLMPIEVPHTHPSTFQRKCLLKENSCNLNGLRVKTRDIANNKNLKNSFTDDDVISGSSVKTLQLNKNRQVSALRKDSIMNSLPLIPCNKDMDALPPVKYSTRRSNSSKKGTGFASATYITVRADQTPREMETFEKNVVVFS